MSGRHLDERQIEYTSTGCLTRMHSLRCCEFHNRPEGTIRRLEEKAKVLGWSDGSLKEFVNECIAFTLKNGINWRKAESMGYKSLSEYMVAFGIQNPSEDFSGESPTLSRILNAYPNETVTILSDLIDRNQYKVVAPIDGFPYSLQCLQGAIVILKSGHSLNHRQKWNKWYKGWQKAMTKPEAKRLPVECVWAYAENSVLNESLAEAFWSRHVLMNTGVSVKNAYTQATGLPAPTKNQNSAQLRRKRRKKRRNVPFDDEDGE